ncbi:ring-cleaving dioxygenase [Shouchella shacheensis]|uniref:ring-cleaving dioxygenase n=1 Tax=Shouchella shacheensis TaxID=1649580 RepID=UPI00073FCBF6|nr:ring-cleaving dioxygenase [Shouchella shacheensis]
MGKRTLGIHHITAIVGDPQENVDFYAGVLGLRLVKKTINFDDPGTYHLYFGDDGGNPGTIMTFFPWPGAHQGRIGAGQVGTTAFAVPNGSMSFWEERLETFGVSYRVEERFGERSVTFTDTHGLQLALVERYEGKASEWSFNGVSPAEAIKGFAGAVLLTSQPEKTSELLEETMGFERVGEEGGYVRFRSKADIGNTVDVWQQAVARGALGVGTVHHIAYRANDDDDQLDWKQHVESAGYHVTPVQPRQYFNAIYFREHGEILFEIATDPPGFAHDESYETMGEALKLPDWYEPQRAKIEQILQPATVREIEKL